MFNLKQALELKLTLRIVLLSCVLTSVVFNAQAQQKPVPVFAAEVTNRAFADELEALGSLQANENVNLTSTVTERIIEIRFEDNQSVAKGDLLVLMDAAQEEAELAEERSRLEEAKRQINRLKPLVRDGVASPSVLDEQEREVNTAKARIRAIESRIEERKISAPFDGVVGIRNISVGALAQPDTLLTTIDDISQMKLDFSVPEVFLDALKPGIEISATTRAYPDRVFSGVVRSVNSRVDPMTRAVAARAMIDNSNGDLKAGMLMKIVLSKNPRNALVVPEEAIITRGKQNYVYVIEQNSEGNRVALITPITLGTRQAGIAEVLRGLNSGQLVVTHGTLRVNDGQIVSIRAIENDDESLADLLKKSQLQSAGS